MPTVAVLSIALVLLFLVAVGAGLAVLALRRSNPSERKGQAGERTVRQLLARLEPARYTVFHSLYLPARTQGHTTELDHVVVSAHGIFVIETKNYSGLIVGSRGDRYWTVTYPGGARRQIDSPIRQNRGHVSALARFLRVDESVITSLVVLVGSARMGSDPGPEVVSREQLLHRNEAQADEVAAPAVVAAWCDKLRGHRAAMAGSGVEMHHKTQVHLQQAKRDNRRYAAQRRRRLEQESRSRWPGMG